MEQRQIVQWRTLAAAALASLTTGCSVGPNFERPGAPRADAYLPRAGESLEEQGKAFSYTYGAAIAADWYTLFQSAPLNTLVSEALANNPDLEAARQGLAVAQYELRAVSGEKAPQVDANTGASRSRYNGSLLLKPANALTAVGNTYSMGASLAYQLDLFGGVRRRIEAQAAVTDSVRQQALNTYVTLVNQVIVTAFNYARIEAQISITQDLIDNLREQLELTARLEEAGKVTRSDTLLAQTQLENTIATLPGLQRQRSAFGNALAQLTGRTSVEFAAPSFKLDDFTIPASLPLSLPSVLVQQRPDVLAAEAQLHQASAEIGVAMAARLPAVTLSGQFSQQVSKLGELSTSAANAWSFGLNITAPIFNGAVLRSRENEAKAAYAQAAAVYRSTVIRAFVEVADSLRALEFDSASFIAYRRALDSARLSRELAEAQFRAGSVTQLQVIIVEQQYLAAALSEVLSRAQRFTDTAALLRALGGGWWNAPQGPAHLGSTDTVRFTLKAATAQVPFQEYPNE